MANNIHMGLIDPFGLQTPEQQVRSFFVAQVGRDLEHFKEWVVYYGFHYEIEASKLEEKFSLWQAQLENTSYVQLQGINRTVPLTSDFKKSIIAEAENLKEQYLRCCKNP